MQKRILAYQNKIKELAVYDFSVNAVSVPELFAHYKDVNFLYPEKNKKIAPFMPLIERNWQDARKAEKEISMQCRYLYDRYGGPFAHPERYRI